MEETKRDLSDATLLRLKQAKNDIIGNRHMKQVHYAKGLLQEYVSLPSP